ncbi:MAG: hypothetical protein V3V00_01180 [Saprospiraceae bacterium]
MNTMLGQKQGLLRLVILTLAVFFLACSGRGKKAEEIDNRPSFYSKLSSITDLSVTISTDYDQLIYNKGEDEDIYQEATMTVFNGSEARIISNVLIRPRGVTRRSLCDFPPLMIKIQKKERKKLDIKKSDNIKLVSFCKDDVNFGNLVMKEYLIYKLYNILTDTSYNVKLAHVTVKDTLNNIKISDQFAFLIEPTDDMARRLGCIYDEKDSSPVKKIHKEQYKNFVVFQYMVGNTDWNLSGRHNIRMLECNSINGPKPVPYDFDYSGLVNAGYAKPHPMLPIKKVTERLFQFRGPAKEDFSATYTTFKLKKSEFYAVINDFPHLDKNMKSEMISFLNEFYTNISNPEIMMAEIMKVRKKK